MLRHCYSGAVNIAVHCYVSEVAVKPSDLHVSHREARLTFTKRTLCLILCAHLELGEHSGYCGKVTWFDSRQGQHIFLYSTPALGLTQPLVERLPGEFLPRFKARGVKFTSKPPSKVMWKY